MEAHCYEAIEKVEKFRKLAESSSIISSAQIVAQKEYEQKKAELDRRLEAFDWIEVIVDYLEEHFDIYDFRHKRIRRYAEANAVIDEVIALLGEVKSINTKSLITMIEHARPGLFIYLSILEQRLNQIEIKWSGDAGNSSELYDAIGQCRYRAKIAHISENNQQRYLNALIGLKYWECQIENFSDVTQKAYEAFDYIVRASSAVECLNSILRPFISVKKHLSRGFLALVALYWNMKPLKQRGGRTPFQLSGVDLGEDDWIKLIRHEMREIDLISGKRRA